MLGEDAFGQTAPGESDPQQTRTVSAARFPLSPVTHPLLATSLQGLWPSLCTIQIVEHGLSPSGQTLVSDGVAIVPGLERLACRLSAIEDNRPTDDEVRAGDVLEQRQRRILKLNGYYPSIVPRQMQAEVDGVVYPIRGIEHDSEHFSTRLTLAVILPR